MNFASEFIRHSKAFGMKLLKLSEFPMAVFSLFPFAYIAKKRRGTSESDEARIEDVTEHLRAAGFFFFCFFCVCKLIIVRARTDLLPKY